MIQILFEVSNNEAKYEALLHVLRLAVSLGIKRLLVYKDSLLVIQQLGSTRGNVPPGVFVQELHHPSVKIKNHSTTDMEAMTTVREVLMVEEDWRIPFIDFIKEFKLPPGVEAKSIQPACIIRRSK